MDADITPGQSFSKDRRAFVDGYWADATTTVYVRRVINGYRDPWTDVSYDKGVEFRIVDSIHGTSYATLSLADFLKAWAS
jgi:hypothetical protein